MSNINTAISTSDEQLFTELTAEEGAVIEGGATLLLYKATALRASSDIASGTNGDDVVVKVNGNKVHGTVKDVETGETFNINYFRNFTGNLAIDFFDADVSPNADDYLGGFNVGTTPTNGVISKIISGSDSKYRVFYRVIA